MAGPPPPGSNKLPNFRSLIKGLFPANKKQQTSTTSAQSTSGALIKVPSFQPLTLSPISFWTTPTPTSPPSTGGSGSSKNSSATRASKGTSSIPNQSPDMAALQALLPGLLGFEVSAQEIVDRLKANQGGMYVLKDLNGQPHPFPQRNITIATGAPITAIINSEILDSNGNPWFTTELVYDSSTGEFKVKQNHVNQLSQEWTFNV